MPRPLSPTLWWAALIASAVAGCATPQAPGGGPVDATPPSLVASLPADGATNVDDRSLVLTFSERLDATSARAVTVTPEGDVPAAVRVSGRALEVTLPPLREATTYVVTIGADLKDQRGVALRAPLTVALATGPTIDRGRIDGRVRDPQTGSGAGGLAVWAYATADSAAAPDVRAVAPDYRTQTGADGSFRLDYLRPGTYFVVAVADRNRNVRADDGEPFASPPTPTLAATRDSANAVSPVTLWTTTRDSIPPEPRRARAISDRRIAVRFSEPVRFTRDRMGSGPTGFTLADSTTGEAIPVTAYQEWEAPFEVVLETPAPLSPVPHLVRYAPLTPDPLLADSAGVGPLPFALSVTPPARADTLAPRFIGFEPTGDSLVTLADPRAPRVRFAAPLDSAALANRVHLLVGGEPRPARFSTTDGLAYAVVLDGEPPSLADAFTLTVRDGDSTRTQRYVILPDGETGGIVGQVESDGAVVVEVRPADGGEPRVVAARADGTFRIDRLAPGPYRLRLIGDRDGDGRWTGGSLVPYRSAEPLRIVPEPVTVRARWETEVEPVDLRAPSP